MRRVLYITRYALEHGIFKVTCKSSFFSKHVWCPEVSEYGDNAKSYDLGKDAFLTEEEARADVRKRTAKEIRRLRRIEWAAKHGGLAVHRVPLNGSFSKNGKVFSDDLPGKQHREG